MEIAIKPDSFKPIMEINRPIPTVIATFIEAGIPTTIICRIDVSVKTRNTRPEMNTAPNAVARIRPYDLYPVIELLVEKQTDFSFPSGHTCASFAAALVYLRMFPERKGWGFVILAVLIGFSRLYVGVHYPTDVLGGFFVGWFASILALKAEAAWERHRKAERERV